MPDIAAAPPIASGRTSQRTLPRLRAIWRKAQHHQTSHANDAHVNSDSNANPTLAGTGSAPACQNPQGCSADRLNSSPVIATTSKPTSGCGKTVPATCPTATNAALAHAITVRSRSVPRITARRIARRTASARGGNEAGQRSPRPSPALIPAGTQPGSSASPQAASNSWTLSNTNPAPLAAHSTNGSPSCIGATIVMPRSFLRSAVHLLCVDAINVSYAALFRSL